MTFFPSLPAGFQQGITVDIVATGRDAFKVWWIWLPPLRKPILRRLFRRVVRPSCTRDADGRLEMPKHPFYVLLNGRPPAYRITSPYGDFDDPLSARGQ